MRKITVLTVALAAVGAALTGCSGSDNGFEGLAAKVRGDKDWSVIKTSGEMIAENEFKHRPSLVTDHRVWAQNERGYWELFTAEEHPKGLNDKEYRYVSYFYGGRAIVAERDKPVSIIDTDGKELASLEEVKGKTPTSFSNIKDGMAVMTVDTLMGVINLKGELIIPVEHFSINEPACGRIIAMDKNRYLFTDMSEGYAEESSAETSKEVSVAKVFDYTGKQLFTLSSKDYDFIADSYENDYLRVSTKSGESSSVWGLLDLDGKVVVKPSAKNGTIITAMGDHYIFTDEDNQFGLRRISTGETVVKAKYSAMSFVDAEHLSVSTSSWEVDEYYEYTLMDLKGEKIGKKYRAISPAFDGNVFVQVAEDRWKVMNIKGEINENAPDFSEVYYETTSLSWEVKSDYIDIDKLIRNSGMTSSGFGDVYFFSSVQDALRYQQTFYSWNNKPKAADYTYTNTVSVSPQVEGEYLSASVIFPTKLSHQNFRDQKIIDYVWGNTYWYHINKVPAGYSFTSSKPSQFKVSYNNYGKLRGKLRPLYEGLVKHFKAMGTVQESSSAATLIDLGNGRHALVALEPNDVFVLWGKLSDGDKSVYRYSGNKEQLRDLFVEDIEEEYGD